MISFLFIATIFAFVVAVIVKCCFKLSTGWCKCKTCMVGKTVIVTGPTSGIGYETALDLAKRGARVILACLDKKEGEETKIKIIAETTNKNISVKLVDMASFESIRAFAKDINSTESRLDVLVNNAGVAGIGDRRTKDGYLYTMQVNYFSPYLLTHLLSALLLKTGNSRVVNVASLAAMFEYNFDLKQLDDYPGTHIRVYCRSKLCLLLFTIELAKRLKDTTVTCYSLHPGCVRTQLFSNVHGLGKLIIFLGKLFFKTSEEGAQSAIHCAVSKDIEGDSGEHFDNCKKVARYGVAKDGKVGEKLWELTKNIVQLKPEEVVII